MNNKVYSAINLVQRDLSKIGISKDRKNVQQGFAFRGIDDIYNATAPLLAEHGLCILPRVKTRESTERATAKGGILFYVVLLVEFDFVSAEDGSIHTVSTYGEAMDSGDKATNKAMSAAYKYALLQAFCIPTEGDNDTDATTHTIQQSVITGKQVEDLELLIQEVGGDLGAFLGYFKAASLRAMLACDYKKAVAMLAVKRKSQQSKEGREPGEDG